MLKELWELVSMWCLGVIVAALMMVLVMGAIYLVLYLVLPRGSTIIQW